MDQLDVFFYLIDFELVAAISDWCILIFVFLLGLEGIVEKIVPVEVLIVPFDILCKIDGFGFWNSQLQTSDFYEFGGWNFFACEKVPYKGYFVDDYFDIVVAYQFSMFSI